MSTKLKKLNNLEETIGRIMGINRTADFTNLNNLIILLICAF